MKNEKINLQSPAEKLLESMNIRFVHIQNNSHNQYYRANQNKKFKGFPDLEIYFKHGKNVFVEFKNKGDESKNKKTREAQIEWEGYLVKNGYRYYLINEIEKFIDILERYK